MGVIAQQWVSFDALRTPTQAIEGGGRCTQGATASRENLYISMRQTGSRGGDMEEVEGGAGTTDAGAGAAYAVVASAARASMAGA